MYEKHAGVTADRSLLRSNGDIKVIVSFAVFPTNMK